MKIDLYDPANWKLYGWSIAHDPEFRKRFARRKALDETASYLSAADILEAHLAAILERTKLSSGAGRAGRRPAPVPLLAFARDRDETLNAALVYYDPKRNRWVTLTSPKDVRAADGSKINRPTLIRAMYLPGDGRVTRASVMGENLEGISVHSPYQTPLTIIHAFFACGGHGGLHNNRILQDNALSVLVREAVD